MAYFDDSYVPAHGNRNLSHDSVFKLFWIQDANGVAEYQETLGKPSLSKDIETDIYFKRAVKHPKGALDTTIQAIEDLNTTISKRISHLETGEPKGTITYSP